MEQENKMEGANLMNLETAKRDANWCRYQIEMLDALLRHSDASMIQANKTRAISAIDSTLEILQELKCDFLSEVCNL